MRWEKKLHHPKVIYCSDFNTVNPRYVSGNDTKWDKSKKNQFFCQIAKLHSTPNEEVRSKIGIFYHRST